MSQTVLFDFLNIKNYVINFIEILFGFKLAYYTVLAAQGLIHP